MDAAKNKKAGARSAKKKKGLAYEIRKALKIGKSDYYDFNLVAVIILIMCFGLIMLYSTSSYMAQINEGDDMFYFKKQALYSIGCLVMAIIESYFDYHLLQKIPMLIYFAAVVLMVLVKTPLGVTSHGARRWLKLGVQFQPAEVAKIAVIICLSYLIVKMGKRVKTLKASMVLLGVGGFQAFLAYWLTQNLSTAIIIFGITVGLVFIAHPKTKPFILVAAVGVVLAGNPGVCCFPHGCSRGKLPSAPYPGMASPGGRCKRRRLSDSAGPLCHWFRRLFWKRAWKQYPEVRKRA